MTILADIKSALDVTPVNAIVGDEGVYSDALPQDKPLPAVVVRRSLRDQVMTLLGPADNGNSIFVFDCWARTKGEALDLAAAVGGAIEGASELPMKWRLAQDIGDEYEQAIDSFVESVRYSFWHEM